MPLSHVWMITAKFRKKEGYLYLLGSIAYRYMDTFRRRRKKTLNSSSPRYNKRNWALYVHFIERLIMHNSRIHFKSWWFWNIQLYRSLWRMLAMKGPPLFSQEDVAHLQTAFMVVCFPSCPLWILSKRLLWHDRVCYADAGQVLFEKPRPQIISLCQSSSENSC